MGDDARAAALAGAALAKTIEDGDLRATYYTTVVLMRSAPGTPGMPTGIPTLEGIFRSAERAGDRALSALVLARVTALKLEAGEIETGAEWALRGLGLAEALGAWYASGFCIAALAQAAAARGDAADAARLHGSLTPIATEVFVGHGPRGHRALSGGERSLPPARSSAMPSSSGSPPMRLCSIATRASPPQ